MRAVFYCQDLISRVDRDLITSITSMLSEGGGGRGRGRGELERERGGFGIKRMRKQEVDRKLSEIFVYVEYVAR